MNVRHAWQISTSSTQRSSAAASTSASASVMSEWKQATGYRSVPTPSREARPYFGFPVRQEQRLSLELRETQRRGADSLQRLVNHEHKRSVRKSRMALAFLLVRVGGGSARTKCRCPVV